MAKDRSKPLLLFDVDGTMTAPRLLIDPEMEKFMDEEVKPRATIGLVGGSDIKKTSWGRAVPSSVKLILF